jgi:hypothetical protein
MRLSRSLLPFLVCALSLVTPATATADLIMEPVFNRVLGSGPGMNVLGFYLPEAINPATGEPFLTADEPGEIVTYPAGFPADDNLVTTVRFFNNTAYDITGWTLRLVGTAIEPEPFNFTVIRDPNVDAIWGDVDGDGSVGHSDIFSTITVSADGRTITFSDGLIPVGGRFTDFNLATTLSGAPFLAAVDASFTGVAAVPEPATLTLILTAGAIGGVIRMRRSRKRTDAGAPFAT